MNRADELDGNVKSKNPVDIAGLATAESSTWDNFIHKLIIFYKLFGRRF